jgi:hypothetical protein
MTLANVTISSGTVTITNVAVTTANVSGTANISTLVVVGNETVGGNTTITGNITAANANVTTNLVATTIKSTTSLNLYAASAYDVNLYTGSTNTARLSSSVYGVFTVGPAGSVPGIGTDYGTLGAWGSAGGGLRMYRGTGAGASAAVIYADGTGLFINEVENAPITFNINGSDRMSLNSTGFLSVNSSSPSTTHAIKATNTTNNGLIFTGSNSVLNDGTLSVTVANGSILMVSDNNVGTGAVFFCGYASSTITLISDPSSAFATSITAGRICVTKSANSSTVTITNKSGSTKGITFSKVSTSD